ncbi:MAG TPA: nucleotide synthetase [Novosphingobium sp.]|nr:nucleotide synthetase [Novosphingobium sp.]
MPNDTSLHGTPFSFDEAAKKGTIELSLTMPGGQLVFAMTSTGGDNLLKVVDGQTCLAIYEKTIASFVLNKSTDWSLDAKSGIMEFKNPLDWQFYTLTYNPAEKPLRSFTLHARPTGKPISDPQNHPFNLFVLCPQPGGAQPLPITIDPDVKNPPPIPP